MGVTLSVDGEEATVEMDMDRAALGPTVRPISTLAASGGRLALSAPATATARLGRGQTTVAAGAEAAAMA